MHLQRIDQRNDHGKIKFTAHLVGPHDSAAVTVNAATLLSPTKFATACLEQTGIVFADPNCQGRHGKEVWQAEVRHAIERGNGGRRQEKVTA